MDKWIEIEDTFLTDVPLINKGRKRIPDPDVEPTQMFLFLYRCEHTPKRRRVRRHRQLKVLTGENSMDLEKQLMGFLERDDVVPIDDQKRPRDYISSGVQPTELRIADVLATA